ncbi:hypothetical protein [Streptosporangium sp. NPDC087985]|uniref:effector-associated constant component EACC1 n=1 Tax=Streptosporangium sp. NPDC087985 TaxID=3366196 RepID=UPI0037FD7D3B
MNVKISVTEGSGEVLRDLAAELGRDHAWRDVSLVESPPDDESLGPILEALSVLVTPMAVSGLVMAVTTWIRYRTSDVDLTVTRTDRSVKVTLSAKRLRALDTAALQREISRLSRHLNDDAQDRADVQEDGERG